ncbi:MAG TPA: hypothetical protein VHA53_11505, partial [Nitrolancea sp.]|nr:hypothetical protein [Nitrolancea sp.]
YRPTTGTATHSYTDGPLAGSAAVIQRGNVTSIGAWSEALITDLLHAELTRLGIPTRRLPEGVRVSRRGQHEVWMNFTDQPVEVGDVRLEPVSYCIRER